MIKTVYFDLGNVLFFFSLPKMFAQMQTCTGLTPIQFQNLVIDSPLRKNYEQGFITTEQLYQSVQNYAPKPFTFHEFTNAFSEIFTPNTELFPIIESLKKSKIRLILLSNTSECHFQYIASHYPIIQLFDHKILSYELGIWKPDPQIFLHALSLSKCNPNECFYIDDIPEFITTAGLVGLPGAVFTSVPTVKKQLNL